jgi:hypothetical protein
MPLLLLFVPPSMAQRQRLIGGHINTRRALQSQGLMIRAYIPQSEAGDYMAD